MDHHVLIDLHRDLRKIVGYRGAVPTSGNFAKALCKLRRVWDSTDLNNAFTVEIAVFFFAFLAGSVAAFNLIMSAGNKVYQGNRSSVFGLVAGLAAICLGLELLFLALSGAIRGKLRLRDRLLNVYSEFNSKDGSTCTIFKLPDRSSCEDKGSGAAKATCLAKAKAPEGSGPPEGSEGSGGPEDTDKAGAEKIDPDLLEKVKAIRNGLLKTDVHQVTQGINAAVMAVRGLIGSGSARQPDDTDYAAVISQVLVPEMLEARRGMLKGTQALGEAAAADSCSEECAETAKSILTAFKAGEDLTTERLERAWADCPDSMRGMCAELERPQDRCAAMCNSSKHQTRKIHTVLGHVPGDDWSLHESAKTEAQCWKACGDDYDAAMFVRKDGLKGSAQCFLHGADSGYKVFVKADAATGAALVKDGSPMILPNNSPAQAAETIVESMKARSLAVDLSAHRDAVFEELARQAPTSHEEDLAWFEDCVAAVTATLAGDEESSGRIPSAPHFQRALENMTAHEFQSKVAWPVLASTVYFDVRAEAARSEDNVDVDNPFRLEHVYHAVCWTGVALACAATLAWLVPQVQPPEPADEDEGDGGDVADPKGKQQGGGYSDSDQEGGKGKIIGMVGKPLLDGLKSGRKLIKENVGKAVTSLRNRIAARKANKKPDESDAPADEASAGQDIIPRQVEPATVRVDETKTGSQQIVPNKLYVDPDFTSTSEDVLNRRIDKENKEGAGKLPQLIDDNIRKLQEANNKSDVSKLLAEKTYDGDFGNVKKSTYDPVLAADVELAKGRETQMFNRLKWKNARKSVSGLKTMKSDQKLIDDEPEDRVEFSDDEAQEEVQETTEPQLTKLQRLRKSSGQFADELFETGMDMADGAYKLGERGVTGLGKAAGVVKKGAKRFGTVATRVGRGRGTLGVVGTVASGVGTGFVDTVGFAGEASGAVLEAGKYGAGEAKRRGAPIAKILVDNAATLALVALVITVACTNFLYWMSKRRHNKQRHRENTEALVDRVCELSDLLGEISGRPSLGSGESGESGNPGAGVPGATGGCWGAAGSSDNVNGTREWENNDALRDLRAAIFAKDRSILPTLPDETRSSPMVQVLTTAQRNRLMAACVSTLQAYDRCNDAAANSSAVFPLSDVIVYGIVSVGCVVAVVYMYTQLEGGAMFDCARKISLALQDARAGKPGAVSFLRAEIEACSQGSEDGAEPLDVVKKVGKWAFVAVVVLATIVLSRESAIGHEYRGDEACAK